MPAAGTEVPTVGQSVEETARATEAPASAAGALARVTVAAGGSAAAAYELSRKRKRVFSSLR
jgi:hypothetical protein